MVNESTSTAQASATTTQNEGRCIQAQAPGLAATIAKSSSVQDLLKQPDKARPQSIEQRDAIKEQIAGLMVSVETRDEMIEALARLLEGVLTSTSPSARMRVARCLGLALTGETWGESIHQSGLPSWAALTALKSHYPAFNCLMQGLEPLAADTVKTRRIRLADNRAFNGVQKPVYQGGALVGHVTEYSDRLAEMLVKGDDPARYNPQSTAQGSQSGSSGPLAIQINVHLPSSTSAQSPVTTTILSDDKTLDK